MTDTNTRTPHAVEHSGATPAPHTCPWWAGYILASPLRKLIENPSSLLEPWVRPGMVVLEPGCGMGYFSLPLAELVGPSGRVICVDVQQKMLDGLARRARRSGLLDRLDLVACGPSDLGVGHWRERVDFAVAIHMVHEVPDQEGLLRQMYEALRVGGALLFREPRGHVSRAAIGATLALTSRVGFQPATVEEAGRSWHVVLRKTA